MGRATVTLDWKGTLVATLLDVQKKQTALIRKIQAASVFFAPIATAIPTTFTAGTGADLTALPAGWEDIGLVTKDDAYTWGRDVGMSETTSHGYVDPTRRDITSNVSSLAFTAQETKLQTLSIYHNLDLSSVVPTPVTGEVTFNDPLTPGTRYHRVIAVGQDGAGTGTIYVIRVVPRAILSEPGEQTWSDENELVYPMTLTATPDTTLGYSIRYVFGGPGWKSQLVSMGFSAVTG
jgi:hypothetical protein